VPEHFISFTLGVTMKRSVVRIASDDSIDRFAFGISIPYLPDLLAEGEGYSTIGDPVAEAYSRQVALLRALSAFPAGRCGVQIRFIGSPQNEDELGGSIAIAILGFGYTADVAIQLLEFLLHARPPEIPMELMDGEDELQVWLDPLSGTDVGATNFAEIRRVATRIDEPWGQSKVLPEELVVLPWKWSPFNLTHSLDVLRAQRGTSVLAVHVEPRQPGEAVYQLLDDCGRFLVTRSQQVANAGLIDLGVSLCQRRMQTLRDAALHVRVFVASKQPLLAGTAEYLGADLTRSTDELGVLPQTFQVVRPSTSEERASAEAMLRKLSSPQWGVEKLDNRALAELLFLFDPLEANAAFRLPVTPRGGLPGITTKLAEVPQGKAVRHEDPDEAPWEEGDPGTRRSTVMLGRGPSAGDFGFQLKDFNEHLLVAGVPGTGKSTTIRTMLTRLWFEQGIPFLVIDPAKTDYSSLSGIARVFRPVLDRVAFNPLAVTPGSSISGHAGRLLAAFDVAFRFGQVFPLARPLLGLALRAAYARCSSGDRAVAGTRWPTIADLYREVRTVIAEEGFAAEAASNLQGSLLSRIEFLIDGGLGVSIAGGPADSIDWPSLMTQNSVIELRAYSSPEERDLLFGLLFTGLVGYRESHVGTGRLLHVTVLEEAHRLLRASDSDSFGTRLFADAIAELRSVGEGFLVVDQAPSSLIPEVSKNSGTKIAHRLLDKNERDFMGDSMVLSEGQKADLARLPRGRAFVLGGSLTQAVVVDVAPKEPEEGGEKPATSFVPNGTVSRPWCHYCPEPCRGSRGLLWSQDLAIAVVRRASVTSNEDLVRQLVKNARLIKPEASATEQFCAVAKATSVIVRFDGQRLRDALSVHAMISTESSARQQFG
jgi:hypothetical protein